jgi:hydrogenase-1 operon protein HyaF
MKPVSIPVRVAGTGSQPQEEPLQYLDMPREMDTFRMPLVPQSADAGSLREARDLLQRFIGVLSFCERHGAATVARLDLASVSPATLEVVNQMLGEGEVSIRITGEPRARIQETVFAGVWRVCELDAQDRLVRDWVEASPVPRIVLEAAHAAATSAPLFVEPAEGAMNSPALLHEIGQRIAEYRPGERAHVVNLTLFPLTPEDHRALEQALPVGPVAIIASGFGSCRITSTGVRDVWRVQYFNSMNTLILNTLEVVGVPEVVLAAPEDIADSRTRLGELVAWMAE